MGLTFLKEEKQYRRLFLAGIVNGIGDRFSSVAVLAMLLHITGSGFAVGVTLAIRLIPFLLFGPIGGWAADKFSRKTILVTTDLVRIVFALSFLFVHSKEDLWIVYISSFILAAGEAIYSPVRKSSISTLVKQENLIKINSLEQVMVGIVLIIGAFTGGIVSAIFGANITFWLNAISFLGAAVILATIALPKNKMEKDMITEGREKRSNSTFRKVVLMSIPIQVLLICEILIASINGIDNVLISVYAVNVYHLGDVGVGLFYGALGMGLMLSFSVANRLNKNFLAIGLICIMLEGMFLLLLSKTHIVWIAFFTFCGAACMAGVGNTCFDTILMKEIPEEHRGKMFGLMATIGNTIMGISMFLAGSALQYISPRSLGMIGGIAYIIIATLLLTVFSTKVYRKRGTIYR
ncbi:MFS transporter [Bacillus sp. FJAT-49732]|uniref:MFS transporter n=1 Tax=Lederbergia citrisecunda TaxID=2833583 RepID=A0A942YK23_9BACI|nr:MFS transporter [Lederbergia citrisecunda]MBS4198739.1 MFS transporter [Lederbergia citrisecunda]